MLSLYWNIGKAIMEIQQGDERAFAGGKGGFGGVRRLYDYLRRAGVQGVSL